MTSSRNLGASKAARGKRRRRPSDLPPLPVPDPEDAEGDGYTNENYVHPHVWGRTAEKKFNVAELTRDGCLERAPGDKVHYIDKTDNRFIKVFLDRSSCDNERNFTDISQQYDAKHAEVRSRQHAATGLWCLELPFLDEGDKWKTLKEYKAESPAGADSDGAPAGSFVRAFWRAADKLITGGLLHLDLVHNAMQNIMVRTASDRIVDLKIVDYGMCRVDESAEGWIASYYNMILHNLLETLFHIYL